MRTRIMTVVLVFGMALPSLAFARGGYHTVRQKKVIQKLGDEKRTGNRTGNAESAEPEHKIVDEPDQPRYGNEVVDPPSGSDQKDVESSKPKTKKPAGKSKSRAHA